MELRKYKGYEYFPAAQQLKNDNGSPGLWKAVGSIIKWSSDDVSDTPFEWTAPLFETKEEAEEFAAQAIKGIIDSKRLL